MAKYYHVLKDDGRRCLVCPNRCQLFGQRDPETGWHGYCSECNVRWKTQRFNRNLRACNIRFSVFVLCAFGIGAPIAMRMRMFLNLSPGRLRASVLLKHTFELRHLLWLSAPADWWMEATDSEAEEERLELPILRTLKEVRVSSDAFVRSACRQLHKSWGVTLLDAISMYLTDPSDLHYDYEFPEKRSIVIYSFDENHIEREWALYQWNSQRWLWNSRTSEWFYVDKPSNGWQRYSYFHQDQQRFYWWMSGERWFIEPYHPSSSCCGRS